MANENRSVSQLGEWRAFVMRHPLPDPWWPLKWDERDGEINTYADISRTHPVVFGVWRESDGTYTVAVKAEALLIRVGKNALPPVTFSNEVKRRHIPDLLTLRTLLITLANTKNTP